MKVSGGLDGNGEPGIMSLECERRAEEGKKRGAFKFSLHVTVPGRAP